MYLNSDQVLILLLLYIYFGDVFGGKRINGCPARKALLFALFCREEFAHERRDEGHGVLEKEEARVRASVKRVTNL